MQKVIYRQGDILLVKILALPQTATQQGGACILAYGEVTGHTHEVREQGQIWVDVTDNGRRFLETLTDTALVHPEHGKITLKGPAVYEIIRQREYTPEAIRIVCD